EEDLEEDPSEYPADGGDDDDDDNDEEKEKEEAFEEDDLTYAEAPLGYKAAMIQSSVASPLPLPTPSPPLLLPATNCRFEMGESSAVAVARQTGLDVTYATNYVTDLATTLARDTHEMYVRFEDAQDDRALQRARVNMLFRDRQYHLHTTMLLESEATR
nr:hypothetical protein [Tanacetum cinerariifolium]